MTLSDAATHAGLGLPVQKGTPHRLLKRLVAKLSWFFLHHQVAFNNDVLDTLDRQVLGDAGLVGRLDAQAARMDAMSVVLDTLGRDVWAAMAALTERLDSQDAELWAAVTAQAGALDARVADMAADLWSAVATQSTRVDAHSAELWSAIGGQTEQIETQGEDLWEAVHKLWAAVNDGRELLDQEQVALKIHVDLMQRQAFARHHEGIGQLRTELAGMSLLFAEVEKHFLKVQEQFSEVHSRLQALPVETSLQIAEIYDRLEASAADARRRQGTVNAFLDRLRRTLPEPPTPEDLEELPDAMSSIYPDFEDVFRGPSIGVTELVKEYLPDVLALDRHGPVVDLGSGRGEWLEVLQTCRRGRLWG